MVKLNTSLFLALGKAFNNGDIPRRACPLNPNVKETWTSAKQFLFNTGKFNRNFNKHETALLRMAEWVYGSKEEARIAFQERSLTSWSNSSSPKTKEILRVGGKNWAGGLLEKSKLVHANISKLLNKMCSYDKVHQEQMRQWNNRQVKFLFSHY